MNDKEEKKPNHPRQHKWRRVWGWGRGVTEKGKESETFFMLEIDTNVIFRLVRFFLLLLCHQIYDEIDVGNDSMGTHRFPFILFFWIVILTVLYIIIIVWDGGWWCRGMRIEFLVLLSLLQPLYSLEWKNCTGENFFSVSAIWFGWDVYSIAAKNDLCH